MLVLLGMIMVHTVLEIRSVQMLPDGRSMVETWGSHRFQILESGTLDGYMVGRIERVDDIPEELEDEAERSIPLMLSAQSNRSAEALPSSSPSSTLPRALQPTAEELLAVCHAFVVQKLFGSSACVYVRIS
ncbi:hypothetical protein M0805_006726 [Coniferiporia weirii]|nr:hypothetical protein M0805_006726 [Coniferiporia weirii]